MVSRRQNNPLTSFHIRCSVSSVDSITMGKCVRKFGVKYLAEENPFSALVMALHHASRRWTSNGSSDGAAMTAK